MPASLNELATKIDQVADLFQAMAAIIADPGDFKGIASRYAPPAGGPIDLRALADEVRQHAAAS